MVFHQIDQFARNIIDRLHGCSASIFDKLSRHSPNDSR